MTKRPRLLIEEWLPIAEIGEEAARERRSMTALPPTYYLHVWWARRPLVAARAAVLASLLPADADRGMFMHILGIHGDPIASRRRIAEAKRSGQRFEGEAYTYKRAFSYTPDDGELKWLRDQASRIGVLDTPIVLDPTAGGGSIPFEASRLGCDVIANDLNPVAWLILKATVEFPRTLGAPVLERFWELSAEFIKRRDERLAPFIPDEPEPNCHATNWLWARTITCPYCGGRVPLSPNWRLNGSGKGVRLHADTEPARTKDGAPQRVMRFEIVNKAKDHSPGTVKGGTALCPFPGCGNVIGGDEIKAQAQSGQMGQQLYAVVFNKLIPQGFTKAGKPKKPKKERGFRAPRPEDDVEETVRAELERRMPDWLARNIVPTEEIDELSNYDRGHRLYGINAWRDFFSPRQLLGHGTSVEVLQDLFTAHQSQRSLVEVDIAAFTYLAIAIDKVLSYNSVSSRWDMVKEAVRGIFDRHGFGMQWRYGELAPTISGLGYDWAFEQTGKALEELIELIALDNARVKRPDDEDLVDQMRGQQSERSPNGTPLSELRLHCGSGDAVPQPDESVDAVVIDPPYYDNVMYAELADFFYVWLKRTAGLVFPEAFFDELTDKEQEAVANPAKFKGKAGGARRLAAQDYQQRMAAIFRECRRVLKPHGVMTVMFTHKASGAWDALASGLVEAGFAITASWPVNTEAEGSLHIKEKSAAKSTIFLVCRPRELPTTENTEGTEGAEGEARYWEDVEPLVAKRVRQKVAVFQEAGIGGVDLYLACFGPALEVFSENWPLTRGRPVPEPSWWEPDLFEVWDPYKVRPEDALDAARREVKRWRMEHLANMRRQHHLDPLTEWYLLAWDAFRAPRFPADEALKLARVVGLDFDAEVKNRVCEAKASDVVLWDSKTRQAKGKLGAAGGACMLDALHHAAAVARDANTGAAKKVIEDAGLLDDATFLVALEAALNVLPPVGGTDFDALEKLRRLAFSEKVPQPKQMELFVEEAEDGGEEEDEDEGDA